MAFVSKDLINIIPRLGNGLGAAQTDGNTYASLSMGFFSYRTDDADTVVETTDYIPLASTHGLRLHDTIFASVDEDGTPEHKIYRVSGIDVDDNATLSIYAVT